MQVAEAAMTNPGEKRPVDIVRGCPEFVSFKRGIANALMPRRRKQCNGYVSCCHDNGHRRHSLLALSVIAVVIATVSLMTSLAAGENLDAAYDYGELVAGGTLSTGEQTR